MSHKTNSSAKKTNSSSTSLRDEGIEKFLALVNDQPEFLRKMLVLKTASLSNTECEQLDLPINIEKTKPSNPLEYSQETKQTEKRYSVIQELEMEKDDFNCFNKNTFPSLSKEVGTSISHNIGKAYFSTNSISTKTAVSFKKSNLETASEGLTDRNEEDPTKIKNSNKELLNIIELKKETENTSTTKWVPIERKLKSITPGKLDELKAEATKGMKVIECQKTEDFSETLCENVVEQFQKSTSRLTLQESEIIKQDGIQFGTDIETGIIGHKLDNDNEKKKNDRPSESTNISEMKQSKSFLHALKEKSMKRSESFSKLIRSCSFRSKADNDENDGNKPKCASKNNYQNGMTRSKSFSNLKKALSGKLKKSSKSEVKTKSDANNEEMPVKDTSSTDDEGGIHGQPRRTASILKQLKSGDMKTKLLSVFRRG